MLRRLSSSECLCSVPDELLQHVVGRRPPAAQGLLSVRVRVTRASVCALACELGIRPEAAGKRGRQQQTPSRSRQNRPGGPSQAALHTRLPCGDVQPSPTALRGSCCSASAPARGDIADLAHTPFLVKTVTAWPASLRAQGRRRAGCQSTHTRSQRKQASMPVWFLLWCAARARVRYNKR